jgi:hypothetical protein
VTTHDDQMGRFTETNSGSEPSSETISAKELITQLLETLTIANKAISITQEQLAELRLSLAGEN